MNASPYPSERLMQDPSTRRLILVLQSDDADRQFMQAILTANEQQPQIMALNNTQDALNFLQRQGQYAAAQRPDLILLDLDLDGVYSGYELLSHIKGDANLRRIPIIVLTLSDRTEDIFKTYASQGNCYVIRPGDRDQLSQIIHRIEEFWLNIVTLPTE